MFISNWMNSRNFSESSDIKVMPSEGSESLSLISGEFKTFKISFSSFCVMVAGVCAGAEMPIHDTA